MRPAQPSGALPRPRVSRAVLLTVLLLSVPTALIVALVAVRWQPLMDWDASVARTVHRHALSDPGTTRASRVLTDWVWGVWPMRVVGALVAALLLWLRAWRTALWLVATYVCGTLVQQAVKAGVDRKRPAWRHPLASVDYAAFPSAHAMTAVLVCGALLWVLHLRGGGGRWWWPAVALAAISVVGVGLTRLWLGVHWPSDVLGGWLLGALVVSVAVAVSAAGRGR
ncbi:phosphatase PAP2 family protein [Streptomyces sp. TS71-3]|uniref:phosphatase PAP2 family protein n=1 Tax=Streptomyces sp. TS71-3 TaxID=2733862 RepID=UPI001B2A6B0B|nr:phosphatase PAP2 family protein [Streptomyces sp. TS71-3]GHJ42234.1 phosphatase PAP2 family protein [Streptomyces sp. TS71-3]